MLISCSVSSSGYSPGQQNFHHSEENKVPLLFSQNPPKDSTLSEFIPAHRFIMPYFNVSLPFMPSSLILSLAVAFYQIKFVSVITRLRSASYSTSSSSSSPYYFHRLELCSSDEWLSLLPKPSGIPCNVSPHRMWRPTVWYCHNELKFSRDKSRLRNQLSCRYCWFSIPRYI